MNLTTITDRLIPANPESEQAVLGSLLIDPDALVNVTGLISPDDFYVEKNRWIYQAILELAAKHMAADFVTVCDELERRHLLEELGGAAYVMDLINAVPTAIHAQHYARIVEEHAVARRLVRGAGQITQLVYEAKSVDAACSGAVEIVEQATRRGRERAAAPLGEVLELTRQQAKDNARTCEEGVQVAIPFGIPELDQRTGGMWPSDVIIIAAPPGAGKTALAIGVAHRAAKAGYAGAIFSLEMQATQVGERILASESNYTALQIRMGDIADWQVLDEAKARASTDNLFVDDSPALTVAELVARVKRLHLRHGIRFVVIDYVQLLTAGKWVENRTQELAHISRSLKALAKELNIAVIAVAQLNRDYGKRQDKKPVMSDLEGSSQWEKDATAIVFIHRESMYVPEADARKATLILAKTRNGQMGEFAVGWNPRLTLFTADPLALTPTEREAYRRDLLRECAALDCAWADWRLHRLPVEQALADARLGAQADALVQKLAASGWQDEGLVRELKAMVKATNGKTPPVLSEFVGVAARAATLQRVRTAVLPALLDGRFAIFTGPSGRGKTLLARIVQHALIAEHGVPAVWLNWRRFLREIKATFSGEGREADVWRQAGAPVLMVDDPDKATTEFSVSYLYDLMDERMRLSGGSQQAVLLVLNQMPKDFNEQLARHGRLGAATAQRGLVRSRPVVVDFGELPVWVDEVQPWF